MASKNRVCLVCGENYHNCSSCGEPDWAYSYCSERCWSDSPRAKACFALGKRLRSLLSDEERFLIDSGIFDNSSYLDKIADGMSKEEE
jgi:hypothetical protein